MRRILLKILLFALSITVLTVSKSGVALELISIDGEEYFQYDQNFPRYIYEQKDISEACYFSLEGLKLVPVNLFVSYRINLYSVLNFGVTANSDDKETVFTYYVPSDLEGNKLYPYQNSMLKTVIDGIYLHDDEKHQPKHHSRKNPKNRHGHWFFHHLNHMTALYEANPHELAAQRYGICHQNVLQTYSSLYEWLKLNYLQYNNDQVENTVDETEVGTKPEFFFIDRVLRKALNIPDLLSLEKSKEVYQGFLRAAIIFNRFPEIDCLDLGRIRFTNGGVESLEHNDPSYTDLCVVWIDKTTKLGKSL